MADEAPNKNDIQLIFKRLRSVPTNKVCFDCNAKNPTWSSVTYGVFICIDCSAVHRSLGVHLTFVRSTQLDTNWTWLQLRQMQLGGNANADSFFRQHNCITTDAQQKYNSRAAQLYREKLHTAAIQAMRLHGTKLHLDAQPEGPTETKKEVDFFEEHTIENNSNSEVQDINSWTPNGSISLQKASLSGGPNVTAALSSSPQAVESSGERKPTIGLRKGPVKKPGLGSKKSTGLGAQRVKANFAEIEREAELADQLRMQEAVKTVVPEKTLEEQETQMASMRLAYQDLSLKNMKDIQNCKDPKKAQQMERLGMGLGSRTGVSHSAISDMKVIEQESPIKNKSGKSMFDRDNDGGFDDFFDSFSGSNSGFSMYKGSRTPTESSLDSILFDGNRDHLNCPSDYSRSSKSSSIWADNKTNSDGWEEIDKKSKGDWGEPERRQPKANTDDKKCMSSASNEAQKKFGSAKAISSDQYFSDFGSDSLVSERKSNLSRFEGSSSISSAEYFGRGESSPGYGSSIQTPDLEDVKESVRQGVTKVAGKLSSLANGVMSSIQEKYGGY